MKKVYLIAVICALIAGFATFMFARQLDAKTTIKDADTVDVYVALQEIPENTEITEEMFAEDAGYFAVKNIVAEYVTPNCVEAVDAQGVDGKTKMIGNVTIDTIYANEQINSARYVSKDADEVALSFKLEEGKVAYSINASAANGVDGYVSVGDTVDIITYDKKENSDEMEAKIAYKDLKVLRVSNNKDNKTATTSDSAITEYSTLTVEVTKKQALTLRDIEDKDYKLILNARSKEKTEDKSAQQVDAKA